MRLDGLYGNAAPLADLLVPGGPGVIVRGRDYHLLDLPVVSARLQHPPDQLTKHPESGTSRALYDCLDIALTPTGPRVRMLLAAHPATGSSPSIGTQRNGTVYEQFFTTVPADGFSPADVLDLYLHRGSFETVLADEDTEQDPDCRLNQLRSKSRPPGKSSRSLPGFLLCYIYSQRRERPMRYSGQYDRFEHFLVPWWKLVGVVDCAARGSMRWIS